MNRTAYSRTHIRVYKNVGQYILVTVIIALFLIDTFILLFVDLRSIRVT